MTQQVIWVSEAMKRRKRRRSIWKAAVTYVGPCPMRRRFTLPQNADCSTSCQIKIVMAIDSDIDLQDARMRVDGPAPGG